MTFRGRVDRKVGKTRRFRIETKATGAQHRRRLALVDRLLELGALDTLRALKDGRLTWPELLQFEREGRLGALSGELVLRRNLWEAVDAVFPRNGGYTVQRYRGSFQKLRRLSGNVQIRVIDLEEVPWQVLAERWETSATDWNHLRRAVSRLISLLTHKHNPFWLRLSARFPRKLEAVRMPKHTLQDLVRVLREGDTAFRDVVRTFLITGIRGGSEYFKPKAVLWDCPVVRVLQSKTPWGRREIVVDPRAWDVVRAGLRGNPGYWSLIWQLKQASRRALVPRLTPHALRHLTGQVLDRAGIPFGVQQSFLGHRPPTETDKYRRAPFTAEHARLLYEAYGPVFTHTNGREG